jgi:hypothetical protein
MYNEHKKDPFVKVIKPVCILPYSIANVPVSVAHKFQHNDCIIEAIPGCQFQDFAVQRIITHPNSKSAACRILNFKSEAIVLRKGALIASINTADSAGHLITQRYNKNEPDKHEKNTATCFPI